MPERLRRDLNLEVQLDVILEAQPLPLRGLAPGLADRLQQLFVLENLDGLFQGLKVLGVDQDNSWTAVASHHETFVFPHHTVD